MADYKHRASSNRSKKKTNCQPAFWFSGGVLAGAFVMGLVWLKFNPALEAGRVPGASPSKPVANTTKPPPRPEFRYPSILPEMEVIIPDDEVLPLREDKPAAVTEKPKTNTEQRLDENYALQMGSFKKYEDADRMKARLALIGIIAEIQKVSVNNKDTYHRVRSGPYRDQKSLSRDRKLARDNNIQTLLLRLKE